MSGSDEKEVVGTVLSVTEDERGVTAEIRLAPGWTIERIEEGLKNFFWGGPDDFNYNEVNMGEADEPIKPHGHGDCWCGATHTSMNHRVKEPNAQNDIALGDPDEQAQEDVDSSST